MCAGFVGSLSGERERDEESVEWRGYSMREEEPLHPGPGKEKLLFEVG